MVVLNALSLALILAGAALAFRARDEPRTVWWAFALGCFVMIRVRGLVLPIGAIVVLGTLTRRYAASRGDRAQRGSE
jgi:hypothetical protein